MLVEPAQAYAETLTEATIEKLSPLTNIVRDSVEGVGEARLSLQEQTEIIRNAMNVLTGEIKEISLDAKINQEQETQINALIDLKEAIEELNINLQESARNRLGSASYHLNPLNYPGKNNMGRRKKESDVGMDLFSFLNIMTATIGVQT